MRDDEPRVSMRDNPLLSRVGALMRLRIGRLIAMTPTMLTAKETAEFLNVSLTWIYRDAPKLGLTGYRFGRGKNAKLRFKYREVVKWLEQQKVH